MTSSIAMSHARRTSSTLNTSRWLGALIDHFHRRPESAAVVVSNAIDAPAHVLTYRRLVHVSARLSGVLAESLKPGDVIMLVAENGPDYVIWFCAAMMAGMRLFPVHFGSTAAELCAAAEETGAAAIIAPEGLLTAGAVPIQRFDVSMASREVDGAPVPELAAPHGAVLLQSSGTTGAPKIVLRESAALDAVAMNIAHAERLSPADRVLAIMPLSHSYGLDVMLATIFAGATLHTMPAFEVLAVAEQLTESATVFPGVPFMFDALSRVSPQRRPAQLRLAFSAGTPLPTRVVDSFHAAWGCPVGQLYGATELGSVTFNHPDSPEFNPASVGIPMAGVGVRILDLDDHQRRLPVSQCGQVAIAAPSMLRGYITRQSMAGDSRSQARDSFRLDPDSPFADGYFLTGDLGHLDEQGRLFITGRLKLLIDVGGLKVNPLEIEAVLGSHPDVAECVALPLPVSDIVTRIRALFVPRDPARIPDSEELRTFLKQRLSAYKIPRVIECVPKLPRSPSGKIQRHLVTTP